MGLASEDMETAPAVETQPQTQSCACQGTSAVEEKPKGEVVVGDIIDVDAIKPNSLIILRVKGDMMSAHLMGFMRGLSVKYGQVLSAKGVTMALLEENARLEIVDEKTMNDAGWHKRGLIITP